VNRWAESNQFSKAAVTDSAEALGHNRDALEHPAKAAAKNVEKQKPAAASTQGAEQDAKEYQQDTNEFSAVPNSLQQSTQTIQSSARGRTSQSSFAASSEDCLHAAISRRMSRTGSAADAASRMNEIDLEQGDRVVDALPEKLVTTPRSCMISGHPSHIHPHEQAFKSAKKRKKKKDGELLNADRPMESQPESQQPHPPPSQCIHPACEAKLTPSGDRRAKTKNKKLAAILPEAPALPNDAEN